MKQILLLEDDLALAHGIALALKAAGQVLPCPDLAAARQALQAQAFDLLLLDMNLPDGSGLDLCREVRRTASVPIIFLTARDAEYDEVAGLEAGADDYIVKPFSLAVLRARVDAALRRAGRQAAGSVIRFGDLQFDFDQQVFTRAGAPLTLSRTEQRLLRLLVCNAGRTLPRALLMARVWDGGEYVDENTLSVAVRRLRQKLEADPKKPAYLRTVYGIGYVWGRGDG